jgi:hypothetical protein
MSSQTGLMSDWVNLPYCLHIAFYVENKKRLRKAGDNGDDDRECFTTARIFLVIIFVSRAQANSQFQF